ncbi:MAG: glycosyltransferase family 39 protein, partial [Planctomycetaceae bacterium]|nr:glycosyltransferase family 39 protein [Planctomycetaceae bacterium]
MPDGSSNSESDRGMSSGELLRSRWRATAGLLLIGMAFIAWRLPSLWREPGWQDEEVHAVPGLTILRTGLPQLPHLPSRNTRSPYYRADEVAFLEPPLYFYVTAAFYALLPDIYGAARLASAIGGILLLVLAGQLTFRCGGTIGAAVWGMGLFMMSRWFYFPAQAARPDVLCAAFGLMAILATDDWIRTHRSGSLIAAGAVIGLGGLTHPFAMAYAVQMAVWMFLSQRGWRRLLAPGMLALVALLVFSAWLLLIEGRSEIFSLQFRNQLIHERGGTFIARLLWPWESLTFHAGFLWPHIEAWQFLLALSGALLCLLLGKTERRPLLSTVGWLSLSGAFLISVLVGPHHPVFGYFSYPAALAFIGIGWGIDRVLRVLSMRGLMGSLAAAIVGMTCILSMLPGSRIRMNLAYLRNWNHINYNAPEFADRLIDRLPEAAVYLVDEEFVLDFVAAGRNVIA